MPSRDDVPGFRPLYVQVRELLVKRIAERVWRAGQAIPSEAEIAADLGVSQGTVRKALDALESERLVVRRQGRGTYVARHDDARILFQFFKLAPDSGEAQFPESRLLSADKGSDPEAAAMLAIGKRDPVVRLIRVRSIGSTTCILEEIRLPARLFPKLETQNLPNNLYELYAREFGVTIGRASEKLKAVGAGADASAALGVAPGAPLLRVDRLAYSLDGQRAEWRVSLCRTDVVHYASELR